MSGSEKTITLVFDGKQETKLTWNGDVELRRGNYLVVYKAPSGAIRESLWFYSGQYWINKVLQAPVEFNQAEIIAIAPYPKYER